MVIYVVAALIAARIKGYRLNPMLKAYALYPYLIVELIFWYFQINIFLGNFQYVAYSEYVKNAFLISFVVPMIVYRLYKPGFLSAGVILSGTLLNRIAIAANGGKMPVFATFSRITGYYSDSALQSVNDIHVIGDAATKMKILTDYIDIGYSILSIGDILIHSVAFIIVYSSVVYLNRSPGDTVRA